MKYLEFLNSFEDTKIIFNSNSEYILDYVFKKTFKIDVLDLLENKNKRDADKQELKSLYVYLCKEKTDLSINQIIAKCKLKTRKSFYDKYNFIRDAKESRYELQIIKELRKIEKLFEI